MRLYLPVAALAVVFAGGTAQAMYPPQTIVGVPVERLVTNVSAYIKRHPDDVQGYYTLARVHSIAFARSFLQSPRASSSQNQTSYNVAIVRGSGNTELQNVLNPEGESIPSAAPVTVIRGSQPAPPPPGLAAQRSIEVIQSDRGNQNPEASLPELNDGILLHRNEPNRPPTIAELIDLRESIKCYAKVTALAPKDGFYWLGYAWMLEQGIPFAAKLGRPWLGDTGQSQPGSPALWSVKAIETYRHAYGTQLTGYKYQYYDDRIIESGEGIERMLRQSGRPLSRWERAEVSRIRSTIARIKKRPMLITPIVIPLTEVTSLPGLLSTTTHTKFDLSGDGLGHHWPWVNDKAGILVWDPEHRGQITSGRQLFGNVTWWVFWKNGYQALAALDDNGDGQLSGRELEGIGIWRDANGNGVSDPGEVKPLTDYGIVSLSTQNTGIRDGVPSNLSGAKLATGATLPTYDWTPNSVD